jgi:GT2 family glycosyltransferase
MQPPKTCVILVSYRGAEDTATCVRSLLDSTVPIEILVVDNTPNDPALEGALRFASGRTILFTSENLGFGRANNLGIQWAMRHTHCDFIFLLNNDTVVQPDTIGTLERAMTSQGEVGIMVPRIAYLDDPDLLWYGGGEIDWRRASAHTPGINRSAVADLALLERDVTFATGCALFLRRSALQELEGFDPRFFMYEEDVELCLRARERTIRVRYLPSAFILHRAQGSNRSSRHARMEFWSTNNPALPFLCYHVIRNRLLNIALHARGKHLFLAVTFFPIFLFRRAGPFLYHGRIDAILAMLRGLIDFWAARRKVPAAAATLAVCREARIP